MEKIASNIVGRVILSNSKEAFFLHDKSYFGEPVGEKIQYTPSEALFLVETGKMDVFLHKKKIPAKNLFERLKRADKNIDTKYPVFKDLREKGYIVKTALKFGADFRVYDRGSNPKNSHARWIVFTNQEAKKLSWDEFAARNRVAHSTKKKLLLAIIDEESDITYYEINWIRP